MVTFKASVKFKLKLELKVKINFEFKVNVKLEMKFNVEVKEVRGGGTVRSILKVGPRFPFNSLELNSGKVWVRWPPGTHAFETQGKQSGYEFLQCGLKMGFTQNLLSNILRGRGKSHPPMCN